MEVAIIILSILLVSCLVNIIILGLDEQFHCDEWLGVIVCIITTPILFFLIIKPIVSKILLVRQKKKMQKRVDK